MRKTIIRTNAQTNCYSLGSGFILTQLVSALEKDFVCILEPTQDFSLVYYDTFDWRLYRQNEVLVLQQYGEKRKLSLEKISDGLVKAVTPFPAANESVISDLKIIPSSLRGMIAPAIAMRALLPMVQVEGNMQKILLRNKHDKIVVRLLIEQNCVASAEQGRKRDLSARIIVNPVKGYLAGFRRATAILMNNPAITPCTHNLLDVALQGSGRHAGDYSSKVKIKLNPEIQSTRAVKDILQHLLAAMEANEPGMIARLDSEFLHDYRVAVRRARSILSQMKGVLPKDKFEFFKKEFSWLGMVTTPTRDLDVYLLEFEKLQLSLLPEMRAALLPFKDFLQHQQQQAQQELIASVTSERYINLKQTLNEFFTDDSEAEKNTPNAKKNIHGQADSRIWKNYSQVKKEAARLTPDSPAHDFHELRKNCKKLRYLLEFFQCFYAEKEISQLIKQLKILQDNLGEFQDMDVQSIALKKFAKMMAEQGVNNAETFMAMGALADGMEHRKIQLQHEFGDCCKQFSRQKYQKLFKKLFKSDVKSGQEPVHESIG